MVADVGPGLTLPFISWKDHDVPTSFLGLGHFRRGEKHSGTRWAPTLIARNIHGAVKVSEELASNGLFGLLNLKRLELLFHLGEH
jgi:hypothetical protein